MQTKTKTQLQGKSAFRERLAGLFLPITTPFRTDETVDVEGLRANIIKWNEAGIPGYVLLGSTGERVHLDEREQIKAIETAREVTPADSLLIAGAGQHSTLGTIKEINRITETVAVDAVLVITPHFYRPVMTQDALVEHFQRVADESRKPVILYSMPALTGIKIEPQTAGRLSEHENIIGIKDSSADIESLQTTIGMVREDFAVLTGNGTVFHPALRAGAVGGILAVGCVAPSLCLAIFNAHRASEHDVSGKLQQALSPLAEAVTTRFGIGGLKAALDMRGFAGGAVRMPLHSPSDEARQEIRQRLDQADRALQEFSLKLEVA